MNTPIYRRTKETQPVKNPYNFQPAAPFGGQKKGERERCVKGLPAQGRAGIFSKAYSFKYSKFLRAFDTARKLSQTPYAERCGGKVTGLYRFSWVSVGYCWGTIQVLYGQSSLQKPRSCGIITWTGRQKVYFCLRLAPLRFAFAKQPYV